MNERRNLGERDSLEHEHAQRLVSDWARGRLDADRAHEVEAHTRSCEVCRGVAEAAAGLDAEARSLAAADLPHPTSDALARYVESPEGESIATLARVGSHVRGCPDCREDVVLMREAAAPAWSRRLHAGLAGGQAPARWLQPALAVATVVLAYPAWVGLVEYPRVRAAAERAVREAVTRPGGAGPAPRLPAAEPRGGGVAALVLHGTTRGGDPIPVLRLRRDRLLQPILADIVPPPGPLAIRLVREPDVTVWTIDGPRGDFWDPVNALVGVLVPTAAMEPGTYRLELRGTSETAPHATARFRVVADRSPPDPDAGTR